MRAVHSLGSLCLLAVISASVVAAAPEEYEQSLSEKLAQSRKPGEVVWLSGGSGKFLSLFEPAHAGDRRRAALILHGLGGHLDWWDVIAPLRSGLPEKGWATLSIQLPVVAPGEPWALQGRALSQAGARITAALAWLEHREFRTVVLVGYGFGGALSAQYLADRKPALDGFVGISMQAPPYLQGAVDLLGSLEKIAVPVMDVYGSLDSDEVLSQADDRRLAFRKNRDRPHQQVILEGADHLYTGLSSALIDRIAAWLDAAVVPDSEGGDADFPAAP